MKSCTKRAVCPHAEKRRTCTACESCNPIPKYPSTNPGAPRPHKLNCHQCGNFLAPSGRLRCALPHAAYAYDTLQRNRLIRARGSKHSRPYFTI